jgi:7,8-dihydropterin-6-yl-methyl-4-(beta-D-ribofuranosyl)aminobenzene 5'-phosphate synthase
MAQAPQFESGTTQVGLMAEHGFSALVTVTAGNTTTSVLFDTGLSPDAMITNADRLGLDLSNLHAVVLSHGHFDHAGGLAGLAGRRRTTALPMVVHPLIWTRRRLALPGRDPDEWPTLSKRALTSEGFEVIERRQPSLLLNGSVLITGEIDRTTDFEHGMPPTHQRWTNSTWEPDPLVLDDQALVVHIRGKGLLVVTGCGHAGAVNIVRHRPATDRGTPPARPPGRPAPKWRVPRAQHRPHRRSTHRHGARLAGARALHRMASPARLRGRATRQLGAGQQRNPLPTNGDQPLSAA